MTLAIIVGGGAIREVRDRFDFNRMVLGVISTGSGNDFRAILSRSKNQKILSI